MNASFRKHLRFLCLAAQALAALWTPPAVWADDVQPIGIVVMHGKGGSPKGHVAELASGLQRKGYLVANLEMPWSGRRDYDVRVDRADGEVQAAMDDLRARGAKKLFVAGHSLGGAFALHFGDTHACDGVIAIAPGSGVGAKAVDDYLAKFLEQARALIAQGKGEEKARFGDQEPSRGDYAVISPPVAYVEWFDPKGAMNMVLSLRGMQPQIPVLYVSPTRDYPVLLQRADYFYGLLPANPKTHFYRPEADHLHSPGASVEEIVRWTKEIANGTVQ